MTNVSSKLGQGPTTYLHDPSPTPFTDEVLENVGGKEAYSFTDGFLGYHQINIALEYRHKMTFVT
jgi:hypothetical protein